MGTNASGARLRQVPRSYFHIFDDLDARDYEGIELRDMGEAKAYAACAARHLMAETLKDSGAIGLDHRIVVADQQGRVVEIVRFRDAVKIEG